MSAPLKPVVPPVKEDLRMVALASLERSNARYEDPRSLVNANDMQALLESIVYIGVKSGSKEAIIATARFTYNKYNLYFALFEPLSSNVLLDYAKRHSVAILKEKLRSSDDSGLLGAHVESIEDSSSLSQMFEKVANAAHDIGKAKEETKEEAKEEAKKEAKKEALATARVSWRLPTAVAQALAKTSKRKAGEPRLHIALTDHGFSASTPRELKFRIVPEGVTLVKAGNPGQKTWVRRNVIDSNTLAANMFDADVTRRFYSYGNFDYLESGDAYADVIVRKGNDRQVWGMALVWKQNESKSVSGALHEDLKNSLIDFFEERLTNGPYTQAILLSDVLRKASEIRKSEGLGNMKVAFLVTACQAVYDGSTTFPFTKSYPATTPFDRLVNNKYCERSIRVPPWLPCPRWTRKMCVQDRTGDLMLTEDAIVHDKCKKGTTRCHWRVEKGRKGCVPFREWDIRGFGPSEAAVIAIPPKNESTGGSGVPGSLKAVVGTLGAIVVLCASMAPRRRLPRMSG